MDITTVNDLNGDPKNPRVISREQFSKLDELLKKFGDLSGVIRNVRTNELVGGHMRIKTFQAAGKEALIQITQRFDVPTPAGTIALGYVTIYGEAYAYREVDWPVEMQKAANLAANKAGGEFDNDLLAETVFDLSQLENGDELLGLTAFDDKEIEKLLKSVAPSDDEDDEEQEEKEPKLVFKITASEKARIQQAISQVKVDQQITSGDEETQNGKALTFFVDQYLASNPLTNDEFMPPELPEV